MSDLSVNILPYTQSVIQANNDAYRNAHGIKGLTDLSPEEQRLVADYMKAPIKSHKFQVLKQRIMRDIDELYAAYRKSPASSKERIAITAKLVDYSRIIRGSDISIPELRAISKNPCIGLPLKPAANRPASIKDIRNGPLIIVPEGLPAEIQNILKNIEMRKGYSYLQYVKDNANYVLFTPQLNKTVTIMTNNDIGTAEELTRTAIVDTYDEDPPKPGNVKTWVLATTIVAEVSHIEWYYQHNDNASLLGFKHNEANSIIVTNEFLFKLFTSCGTLIDKDERSDIFYALSENTKRLMRILSDK